MIMNIIWVVTLFVGAIVMGWELYKLGKTIDKLTASRKQNKPKLPLTQQWDKAEYCPNYQTDTENNPKNQGNQKSWCSLSSKKN